jgi:hypothetical protein
MEFRFARPPASDEFDSLCEFDALLHPAQAFAHPTEVVNDLDLSLDEKRAILASWASDACAVEAVPTLRRLPGSKRHVHFDEVMDALRALDREAQQEARKCTGAPRDDPHSGTPDGLGDRLLS